MIINKIIPPQHIININGTSYYINFNEFEGFIKQCEQFMSVENDGLENMTKIIADELIDKSNTETLIEEFRKQLKFLREVGFLMKSLIIPVIDFDKD